MTIYRHINYLLKEEVLIVKSERKVRGSVERLLAFNEAKFAENTDIYLTQRGSHDCYSCNGERRYRRLDAFRSEGHIRCLAPEGLTHILRANEGKNSLLNAKKTYRKLMKEPLDAELIGSINDWLDDQK